MADLSDVLREFFAMGGYAFYVWTSYAVTFVVLGGLVGWHLIELRRVRRETLKRARVPRRGRS